MPTSQSLVWKKVVEPEADRHLTFGRDGRKEAAAQDDNIRAWQPEGGAVEQDKLSQRPVLADVLFEGTKDVESVRPIRMIRFMIAGDEEHSTELVELSGQEGKAVVPVRDNVAHVAKQRQVGCLWHDLEDIVGFGGL
jgi:hypothetical protein